MLTMNKELRFHVERGNFGREVRIYGSRDRADGSLEVLLPATARTLEADTVYNEPCLSLRPESAQQLMDALWAAGFRPVDGHGSAGQIGATERHLADMRALVASQLNIVLK